MKQKTKQPKCYRVFRDKLIVKLIRNKTKFCQTGRGNKTKFCQTGRGNKIKFCQTGRGQNLFLFLISFTIIFIGCFTDKIVSGYQPCFQNLFLRLILTLIMVYL